MTIIKVNKYKSKEKWIWAGRGTPLGNPFYMKSPEMRDKVCDDYENYFFTKVVLDKDPKMLAMLTDLKRKSIQGDTYVACVCDPARCHVDTIVNYTKYGVYGLNPTYPELITLKEAIIDELSIHGITRFTEKYHWLSNFSYLQTPIVEDGISYSTVEHYFQAMKSLDPVERALVADLKTPGESKRRGRRLKLRADWEDIKEEVMYTALKYKFNDPKLKDLLLATGDRLLVEGNWHNDTYWGVCLTKHIGSNRLGALLMRLRDELRGVVDIEEHVY